MSITCLADLADAGACPRVVLKVGSALLMGRDGKPHREWLGSLVAEIAAACARGQQVIVVSSGAIAAFGGVYYAIAVLTDSTYREEFLEDIVGELRETFALRTEYLALRGSSPRT